MTGKKSLPASLDMHFGEALSQFLQTDPKELEDEFQRVKKEAEEAKAYVEERRKSIKRGARRAPKRFSL